MTIRNTLSLFVLLTAAILAQTATAPGQGLDGGTPRGLSGTVVDASGALIAGASVQLESTDGSVQRTARTDADGLFTLSGLAAGSYRLVVSRHDFESREMTVNIGSAGAPAPLRISLAVSSVSSTVRVQGREDDLIGVADSATQGTVGAAEIRNRPLLRTGEVLETVPGVIITQHAGGGKANQYFLRGFNLDHGTDFAIFLDGMPLNLPSHAHGEGYSDVNIVIPELVQRVNYEKGPYYADVGNYGSAGSAHLEFVKTLSRDFLDVEGGMFGYGRAVWGVSRALGAGNLLFGGEVSHDDGPWTHPDAYLRYNGLLTYSLGGDARGLSITARGYHGSWSSSDQIAANAVPLVGLFGALDPTDGGRSERYSLQAEGHRVSGASVTTVTPYVFYYDLNLYSNFTYYLTDPVLGDQFNQNDRRWVAGLDARHTIFSRWLGRKVENTFGFQLRNDWINNGLYQSSHRMRVDKNDLDAGALLPATTQRDNFTDMLIGIYGEDRIQWAAKLRSIAGLRGDVERFDVTSLVTSANSGTASTVIPSPKISLILGPWSRTELYLQGGASYHSNDGRGTTLRIQPVSADNPYPNTPATPIPPLIPTKGAEVGARTAALPRLNSTLSVWYLHSKSELQQDGDTGGTTASKQPSDRYGFEFANYYTAGRNLAVDLDLANSKALFTRIDADDAAPESPGGRRVPEAVGLVIASGVTVPDVKGLLGSLRLRYFGPRDLTSDGIYRSKPTALLNGEIGYRISETWHLTATLLNLLNRRDHDIDYAYLSRITPTATPAFTDVLHPVEPFQVRFSLRGTF